MWFNGGPGCSSLIGLTGGNGPISFHGNSTNLISNPYSWTKLGHVLYVDQPVGTGFSTASKLTNNNEQVTTDFVRWLQTFFTYFPHLQSKNVHLTGESYAGIYIPYFANEIMSGAYSFPMKLRSMSIGDGSWGNPAALSSVAMGSYLNSQASRLNVPENILSAFKSADHTCGFDTALESANTYPPRGKIHIRGNPEDMNYRHSRRDVASVLNGTCDTYPSTPEEILASILNSTCYGPCSTYSSAVDYVSTTSEMVRRKPCFDIYDISHNCSSINPLPLLEQYFGRSDVQAALNIKNSGEYITCSPEVVMALLPGPEVVPPVYEILPSLVTDHNISLHIYNGELDMLINHIGTELSIQNMTWGGAQGFSQKPDRVFFADNAAPKVGSKGEEHRAGTWGSERGVSYHLFEAAGHSVFATKQREMFAFVRDVVIEDKA